MTSKRIKEYCYLSFRLFRKEQMSQVAHTKLGIFWDFMESLAMAGLFTFLAAAGLISNQGLLYPYPLYVIFGFILYQSFSDSLLRALRVIAANKDILKHQKIPTSCLFGCSLCQTLYFGLVRFVILGAALLLFGYFSLPGFLAGFIGYMLLCVLGMSLGMLLAPFNAIYEDIGRFSSVVLSIMRFGTPVMWVFPYEKYQWVYIYNPVAMLIDSTRSISVSGTMEFASYAGAWTIATALLLVFSFHVMRRTVTVVVEYLA
jgi:lipopolysaccharide transport system permease protein